MRSLARALSSSRRAPPKAASKLLSLMASSSVTVWRRLREPMHAGVLDLALVDRVLHLGDDESRADARDGGVAELDDLGEVLSGVDVHDRKGQLLGREGLDREVQQHRGVLAAGEEQDRAFALRDDLSEDENGVGLQQVEVVGGGGSAQGCRRHSPCRSPYILVKHSRM